MQQEPGSGMNGPRLVAFLGTGNYREALYACGDQKVRSRYVARVLAEAFRASSVRILATEEARKKHADGLSQEFSAAGLPQPEYVSIPSGATQQEQWQIFNAVANALSGAPSVVLDITHGFRSAPFFAGAVVAFLRAVGKAPAELRVVYGAFEAPGEPKPVWDYTAVVEVADWAAALRLFLKTGNPSEVRDPLNRLGRELAKSVWQKKKERRRSIVTLAQAIERFGMDLATVRIPSLLQGPDTSATQLARVVEEAREDVHAALPPLSRVLDDIENLARQLPAASSLAGPDSVKAFAALAQLYLDLKRYPEALIALREGWVSLQCTRNALDRDVRKRAEERLYDSKEWRTITDYRNDVEHGGMNEKPKPWGTIQKGIPGLIDRFEQARPAFADPGGHPEREQGVGIRPVFANLSKHPSEGWSPEQRDAARALAPEIRDVPIPDVPPQASPDDVLELARRIVQSLPPGTTHAMVQTEHTLSACLVRLLEERGIVCLAATTEREVRRSPEGEKISTFRFVRFRRYPKP